MTQCTVCDKPLSTQDTQLGLCWDCYAEACVAVYPTQVMDGLVIHDEEE